VRLYVNDQMVLPVLGRMELRKTRSEACATLTAALYTAAGDTYFQKLSLSVGDAVRLLDDDGQEAFLGSVLSLRRTAQQVELTACDRGVYLTRNELTGVFCGSPAAIVGQVAEELGIPAGTVETESGWKCISAGSSMSAFAILRQAVGEQREIFIRDGRLHVTKSGYMVYPLDPSRVLEAEGEASALDMVNRAVVTDRTGAVLATAAENGEISRYGRFQAVLARDGTVPAQQAKNALRGLKKAGEVLVLGNLNYRCGDAVELHRPDWGLDGVYAVTGAAHLWERGLYTTNLTLEWMRG